MLKQFVIGNLGQNAKLSEVNGRTAINFSVAHNEKYKLADGTPKETTIWVNCTKWIQPGGSTKIADYLKKGTRVFVDGIPSVRTYQQNGQTFASMELQVRGLELLDSAKEQAPQAPVSERPVNEMPENTDFEHNGTSDDNPF